MGLRTAVGVGACGLLLSGLALPGRAAAGSSEMVRLEGSQAILPVGVFAQTPVAPDARVAVQVQLRLRDQSGADALALAVSTPGSPDYRRYRSADEFRARFSPTDATVAQVSAWLTSQGLTVTSVPANHFYVAAEGTAAQVEAAFSVGLATIEINGGQRRVNTSEPAVPAELAPAIDGVTGLTEVLAHPTRVGGADEVGAPTADPAGPRPRPPPPRPASAPPARAPTGGARTMPPASPGTGAAIRTRWRGRPAGRRRQSSGGPTRSTVRSRAASTARACGWPSSAPISRPRSTPTRRPTPAATIPRHPLPRRQLAEQAFLPEQLQTPCGIGGWYGEQTLDVEAVHAMAPGATILAVGARSCADPDLLEAITAVVDGQQADIVSNSYGYQGELLPEASVRAALRVHTQAAIQGIGFIYSSGDDGDWSNDSSFGGPLPSAVFPASSPLATAVGGTSLGLAEDSSVALERGWTTGTSSVRPRHQDVHAGRQG